jgi:hypothetical protein
MDLVALAATRRHEDAERRLLIDALARISGE